MGAGLVDEEKKRYCKGNEHYTEKYLYISLSIDVERDRETLRGEVLLLQYIHKYKDDTCIVVK